MVSMKFSTKILFHQKILCRYKKICRCRAHNTRGVEAKIEFKLMHVIIMKFLIKKLFSLV